MISWLRDWALKDDDYLKEFDEYTKGKFFMAVGKGITEKDDRLVHKGIAVLIQGKEEKAYYFTINHKTMNIDGDIRLLDIYAIINNENLDFNERLIMNEKLPIEEEWCIRAFYLTKLRDKLRKEGVNEETEVLEGIIGLKKAYKKFFS